MLLGAAYERGHLPVSVENLRKAVALMVPAQDREENLRAFELGRQDRTARSVCRLFASLARVFGRCFRPGRTLAAFPLSGGTSLVTGIS